MERKNRNPFFVFLGATKQKEGGRTVKERTQIVANRPSQEYMGTGVMSESVVVASCSRDCHRSTYTASTWRSRTGRNHSEIAARTGGVAPVCVYTFICVEIKRTPKQSLDVCFKRCRRCWCHRPDFFNFCRGEAVIALRRRPDSSWAISSSLYVLLTTNPMGLWQVLLLKEFWVKVLSS